ncbi:hypothetical protein Calow_0009 [Caldicellulosiruptor owensensis OL]|uniref:PrcB C-terminal domain-containing protein n=1 Tax=Caldicellulosiruptor owensensis (strain ATCC 700167 / DSM 13100 / OL) TaxID=632518 RepID=E4Q1T0_CALOW|nr:protease complex subunit PrcB family protein [Caldicellulosiruptor owensensis]ADQ03629.1 hypothetical protein Calow_0009 [Caldicellulosiruptor owensensis OL]
MMKKLRLIVFFVILSILIMSVSFAGDIKSGIAAKDYINGIVDKQNSEVTYQMKDGYIYIYWGQKPTGGYLIKIKELKYINGILYVYYYTKSPAPTDMVTQVITYPSDKAKLPTTEEIKEVKLINITDDVEAENGFSKRYFPLTKGSYWIYNFRIKEKDSKGNIVEKSKKVKMQILNEYKSKDYVLYEAKGDIINVAPEKRFGFISVSDNIYMVDESVLNNIVKNIKSFDSFEKLIKKFGDSLRIVFKFPLLSGKRYPAYSYIKRKDVLYSWVVEKEKDIVLKGKKYNQFKIEYRSLPERISIGFVCGIGITFVEYHHNGSTYDAYASLIDFKVK